MRLPRNSVIKLSSIIIFAIVASVALFGAHTAHAEFDCGTYGAGDGFGLDSYDSQNCDTTAPTESNTSTTTNTSTTGGGTTTTTSDDTQPTAVDDVTTQATINLNDYGDYTSGIGKTLELVESQVIHFTFNGVEHTITIKTITDSYIVVTIASTPHDVTVQKGQTVKYDVDGDGSTDISIAYVSQTAGVATITFNQLLKPAPTNATSTQPTYWWALWTSIAIVVVVVIIILVIVKTRKPTAKDQ
jgi:hypothetical protein